MSYNANSIELRAFKDACRETPGMYLGADREDGIFNSFLEILNNSCDEAIMGRGNHIIVTLSDDLNICTIQDFGAGIPRGPNDKSKEISKKITEISQKISKIKVNQDNSENNEEENS